MKDGAAVFEEVGALAATQGASSPGGARGGRRRQKVSSIYRTAPWGYLDQEDFANACALATTTLDPAGLLAEVKTVEAEMGRRGGVRWGPRLIDIDILFYGDEAFHSPDLVLPHKELFNRAFVLAPLAEIAPGLRLGGRSVAEAAAKRPRGRA